jgi:hypothetical protein
MTGNRKNLSCEQFSAQMAKLVAAGEDLFSHPHVRKCRLHRALLEDLEEIARAARQLFPEIDPPETLWNGIQARLAQEFSSITSDPWPGCRVVVNAQVLKDYNPTASPPLSGHLISDEESAPRMKIHGAGRTIARRERHQ